MCKLDLASKELTKLSNGTDAHPIRIPNHMDFDADGNLYLTDSGAFREVSGLIYKITPDGATSIWHEGPFNFTNGISISPDGSHALVACTWLSGIERIEINSDGSAGERSTLVTIEKTLPDSVLHGADGWLYISCYEPSRIYRCKSDGSDLEVFADDWEAHALCHPTGICIRDNTLFASNLGRWHISSIIID